jgi:predicted nucleotidyltransferase
MSAVTLTPTQLLALAPLLAASDAPRLILVGATALNAHVPLARSTDDVDLVAVAAPSAYEPWFEAHGFQRARRMVHRWERGRAYVDVLPATADVIRAGTVELQEGVVMSTAGFDLVLQHAQPMRIAGSELTLEVASLATLVVLKLAAWNDRPVEREKDLDDIMHVLRHALPDDADCRWDAAHPVSASGVEFEFQSAFFVGLAVGAIIGPAHRALVHKLLDAARDEDGACFARLAQAYPVTRDQALRTRRALDAFSAGLRVGA